MEKKKIELIEELKKHRHSFLNKDGCNHFLKPFCIETKTNNAKANPQDFKGLSLWDKKGNPIDKAEGLSGLDISYLIIGKLNITTITYFGRGFQHQANCEAIIKELNK